MKHICDVILLGLQV